VAEVAVAVAVAVAEVAVAVAEVAVAVAEVAAEAEAKDWTSSPETRQCGSSPAGSRGSGRQRQSRRV
jgi:hypothetical protein